MFYLDSLLGMLSRCLLLKVFDAGRASPLNTDILNTL